MTPELAHKLEEAFANSAMKPEVYEGYAFEVETLVGTECVPLLSVFYKHEPEDPLAFPAETFTDYLEGEPCDLAEYIDAEQGWLARIHLPGYSDSTPWALYQTAEEAVEDLIEMYGEEN